MGDVVGLLDNSGALVVEYKYDAWGKPIATTGSLAATLGKRNPFRYRGYIYDEETELYYLRSRYYNPLVGRFVNADVFVGIANRMLSHNQYAYASNSPVCRTDASGYYPSGYYIQQVKDQAAVISAADGPLPFADMLVVGLLGSALLLEGVNYLANSWSSSRTSTKSKTKTQDEQKTYIYRKATGTAKSLTPRTVDTNGLSFTTVQPTSGKYFRTTIEKVNASGVLIATFDPLNPTHVLINPVDLSTLQDWIDSRETADTNPHIYTLTLMALQE